MCFWGNCSNFGPNTGFWDHNFKIFFWIWKSKYITLYCIYTLFWLSVIYFSMWKNVQIIDKCVFLGYFPSLGPKKWVVRLKINYYFSIRTKHLSRFQKHFTELKNITPMLSYDQICKCLYRICFILTSLPGWNSCERQHRIKTNNNHNKSS